MYWLQILLIMAYPQLAECGPSRIALDACGSHWEWAVNEHVDGTHETARALTQACRDRATNRAGSVPPGCANA
jgi:hypothetical protein